MDSDCRKHGWDQKETPPVIGRKASVKHPPWSVHSYAAWLDGSPQRERC
jgi:hypothetical protein